MATKSHKRMSVFCFIVFLTVICIEKPITLAATITTPELSNQQKPDGEISIGDWKQETSKLEFSTTTTTISTTTEAASTTTTNGGDIIKSPTTQFPPDKSNLRQNVTDTNTGLLAEKLQSTVKVADSSKNTSQQVKEIDTVGKNETKKQLQVTDPSSADSPLGAVQSETSRTTTTPVPDQNGINRSQGPALGDTSGGSGIPASDPNGMAGQLGLDPTNPKDKYVTPVLNPIEPSRPAQVDPYNSNKTTVPSSNKNVELSGADEVESNSKSKAPAVGPTGILGHESEDQRNKPDIPAANANGNSSAVNKPDTQPPVPGEINGPQGNALMNQNSNSNTLAPDPNKVNGPGDASVNLYTKPEAQAPDSNGRNDQREPTPRGPYIKPETTTPDLRGINGLSGPTSVNPYMKPDRPAQDPNVLNSPLGPTQDGNSIKSGSENGKTKEFPQETNEDLSDDFDDLAASEDKEFKNLGVGGVKPMGARDDTSTPSSGHFMAYFVTATVFVVIGYITYHNRAKIFGLLLEGRNGRSGRRRPNSGKYQQLNTQVEEALPGLDKKVSQQNFIY